MNVYRYGNMIIFINYIPTLNRNNNDLDKFNHDNTSFKLDGGHLELYCLQCHKSTDNLIRNYKIYKFEDISCESCH